MCKGVCARQLLGGLLLPAWLPRAQTACGGAHSEMIFLPILPYTFAFLASALPCKQEWGGVSEGCIAHNRTT